MYRHLLAVFALVVTASPTTAASICTPEQVEKATVPTEPIRFLPGEAAQALKLAYGCEFIGGRDFRVVTISDEPIGGIVGWLTAQEPDKGQISDYVVFKLDPELAKRLVHNSLQDNLFAVPVSDLKVASVDAKIGYLEVAISPDEWAAYNPQSKVQDRPVLTGPQPSVLSGDPGRTLLAQMMTQVAPKTPKMSAVTFRSSPEGAQIWLGEEYLDDTVIGFVLGNERVETMRMSLEGYEVCEFKDAIQITHGYAEYTIACSMVALPAQN